MEGTPSARGLSPAAAPTRSNGLAVHRSPGHYIFYNADAPRAPLVQQIHPNILCIFLRVGRWPALPPRPGCWCMAGGAPRVGGSGTAVALGLGCVCLFFVPAWFVSRGSTIAGDRQYEKAEDILKLDVNAIQRKSEEKHAGTKPR